MPYKDQLPNLLPSTVGMYWGRTLVSAEKLLADLAAYVDITAVADGGGGTVVCTSTAHALHVGSIIIISDTLGTPPTGYDGIYTVISKTTNTFTVTAAFVSDQTGHWTYNSAGEARVYWLEHYPVSTDNLRLVGFIGAEYAYIGNFELEPMTGRVEITPLYPVFDYVLAYYSHYANYEINILTNEFKVPLPRSTPEIDIFGQPRYTKITRYPSTVNFNMALLTEAARNLLTESMLRNYNFLLLDDGIPEGYGKRAYEGGIVSDDQASIYKGASNLLPITMEVQQFGLIKVEKSGLVGSIAEGYQGASWTAVAVGTTELAVGDWITLSEFDDPQYNGTWKIGHVDGYNVDIHRAFGGFGDTSPTKAWVRPRTINWSAFEHTT